MVKLSCHDLPPPPTTAASASPKLHSIKRAINLSWILHIGLLCGLCSFFYILGAWQSSSSSSSLSTSSSSSSSSLSPASSTFIAMSTSNSNDCVDANKQSSSSSSSRLDFEAHHHDPTTVQGEEDVESVGKSKVNDMKKKKKMMMMMRRREWAPCDLKYSEYTPCEDTENSLRYERERLVYRERHCPKADSEDSEDSEGMGMALNLLCLIPAPPGYRNPPPWPRSRDVAWFGNVPHRELTIEKAVQNWVQYDGATRTFRFPGGGTMFPNGAKSYIDDIHALIRPSLADGSIRTALDTGCGVASWGAYLLDRNILTMSFAPRDTHEAQVQFALERGVPAMLGVMASQRLPYPARAFDMAHCSRCLIPWKDYDGVYLIEVDRVLRPGGYWILSGPPINWETHWKGWQRTKEDLAEEQEAIESLARSLCWKKVIQKGNLAIWQKPWNHIDCIKTRRVFKTPPMCKSESGRDGDTAWYTKMETCITPLPDATDRKEVSGGALSKWPARLSAIPPRILLGTLPGITSSTFTDDTETWRKRVDYYKSSLVPTLGVNGRYRNIMDMNAGFGGFAATLEKDRDNVWVMNVVPTIAKHNTLGVIYERGLIGTYQDWCEAFSTYPRTYDFIHADTIFGMYQDRCNIARILLEMDRILRPEGAVIVRDDVDVLNKVAQIASRMRWEVRLADHESGPFNPQKILIAVKTYWVGSALNSTQSG